MRKTITPSDMKRIEQEIIEKAGLNPLLLMEHAAIHLIAAVRRHMAGRKGRVLFLCGPGNNGGDGLAAARLWRMEGGSAIVWQLTSRMTGSAGQNLQWLKKLWPDVPLLRLSDAAEKLPPIPQDAAVIVDALFGTGLNHPLQGVSFTLAQRVNESGLPVIAADIPSGIHGMTGQVMGEAFRAAETVTFHRPKQGLYLGRGPEYAGSVTVADIGLPPLLDSAEGMEVLLPNDLPSLLPPRRRDTHKGDYGRVLIVAGSFGMAGAAGICAQAALKTGAGLVTMACPETIVPIVQSLAPCATCIPLPMNGEDMQPQAESLVQEAALRADAVAVGPGLSVRPDRMMLLQAVQKAGKPTVWDADALNLMALSGDLSPMEGVHVYTPHPGEAARLLQLSVGEITADTLDAIRVLWEKLGGVVLLKGASTPIWDGETMALNVTGTPALAKGGSGDALTGIIAALLAQRRQLGLTPIKTVQLGCCLHGHAALMAAGITGERGLTAADLIAFLGKNE